MKRPPRRRHPHSDSNVPHVGLARALSKLGYCSRARAFDLIRSARVRLNGSIRRNPETPVHLNEDRIEVDGRLVVEASKTHLMLNKPRGVITTASDEKGRDTVYSCLRPDLPWMAPVGRLDKASEGLLLLTNDTVWSARVLAPETHLDKTYHVQISRIADAELLNSLLKGPPGREGETRGVKRASLLRCGERNSGSKSSSTKARIARSAASSIHLNRSLAPHPRGNRAACARRSSQRRVRPLTASERFSLDSAMRALEDC